MRTKVKNAPRPPARYVTQMIEAGREIDRTEHNPAIATDLAKIRRRGEKPATEIWGDKAITVIIDRVSAGETLTRILREEGMPSYATFHRLMANNDAWRNQLTVARKQQAQVLVEKTLDEADQETDPAMAALLRVKSDSRRWAASRFAPDVFGETKRLEVSGEVRHAHVLDLAQEQRRRIAEEWLMSSEATSTARKPLTIDVKPERTIDASLPQPDAKPQETQGTPETQADLPAPP